MRTSAVLQQLATYLEVVHGIDLDLDERTCDYELGYYAVNLHDDVLYDAWKSYAKERLKGAGRFKLHFEQFRARLAYQQPTIKPFYAVAKSLKLDFRSRLRDEKIYMDWY